MTRRRLYRISLLFGVGLLTFILYGRALSLPYFFDDLDHIPYIQATTLPEMWLSTGGFPYYRPLVPTLSRLLYLATGELSPVLLHGWVLVIHAINAFLVGLLVEFALDRDEPSFGSGIASLFYLIFPLSYQAVTWAMAVTHPLALCLTLVSILCGVQAFRSDRWGWYALWFASAALAPFSHENGILAVPLLAGAVFCFEGKLYRSLRVWHAGIAVMPIFIWGTIWTTVPKGRSDVVNQLTLEPIFQNGVYFLQALGFPVTMVGGRLVTWFGWDGFWVAFGLGTIGLLLICAVFFGRGPKRLALFGLFWFGLAAAPALITLSFAYVLSSPRLVLFASAGIAIAWAAVFEAIWQTNNARMMGRVVGVGLAAMIVIGSSRFVRLHVWQHQQLGRVWHAGAEAVDGADSDVVFINFPHSMAAQPNRFPLGHEGTVFMVNYIPHQRIMEVQLDRTDLGMVSYRAVEDIRPKTDQLIGVLGDGRDWPAILASQPESEVWLADVTSAVWGQRQVGAIQPGEPGFAPDYQFLDLSLAVNVSAERHPELGHVEMKLEWLAAEPIPFEYTIFVHGLDSTGALIAQADGQLWANTLPMGQLPINHKVADWRVIDDPNRQVETISIGVYNWVSGERVSIQGADSIVIPIGR